MALSVCQMVAVGLISQALSRIDESTLSARMRQLLMALCGLVFVVEFGGSLVLLWAMLRNCLHRIVALLFHSRDGAP
eukprot:CAMPEP_0177249130 /NCGR_PEP_ID=MMETSP0367-20130122/52585_1 /TAXON_ID=447022 ORGANISM="Scrippsiella hangoei-like, Strain SHHI-4" /NCGR_SAMPLE_ID=MMETSP0367 /ASSEMBLY_ACC=CAM_ASM_000362 /LENGTH=76 /DNA_ID=CAMNT_0018701609 /DNA_START=10 /DNA_END=236 /DNA_ORIENTATION=-